MPGCLIIKHFPAWAVALACGDGLPRWGAQCGNSGSGSPERPLIIQERDHIVAHNRAAILQGIERGMTAARAMSLCPEAELHLRDPVAEFGAWEYVLERMNRITPFMESDAPGGMPSAPGGMPSAPGSTRSRPAAQPRSDTPRLWLGTRPAEVREVARELGASMGFARHRSTAWLASLQAAPGQILRVSDRQTESFQDAFPVALLFEAGFSEECIEGIEMLGCSCIGTLRTLTQRHLRLAYGKEGERLYALLHPEDDTPVRVFHPSPSIRAHFELAEPCYNAPPVVEVVGELAEKAYARLGSHIVGQIRVHFRLEGHPDEKVTRLLTHPTARLGAITRFAERLTTEALARIQPKRRRIGIERIELELAGLLTGDTIQTTLFDRQKRRIKAAVAKVHRRYPRALKRPQVREGAHFHEDRSTFRVWE